MLEAFDLNLISGAEATRVKEICTEFLRLLENPSWALGRASGVPLYSKTGRTPQGNSHNAASHFCSLVKQERNNLICILVLECCRPEQWDLWINTVRSHFERIESDVFPVNGALHQKFPFSMVTVWIFKTELRAVQRVGVWFSRGWLTQPNWPCGTVTSQRDN